MTSPLPLVLERIAHNIEQAGGTCYLVGGWVRDRLLGEGDSKDYDIEVYGLDFDTLQKILKKHGWCSLVGKAFGVAHFVSHKSDKHGGTNKVVADFSFPRTESKVSEGHRGFEVTTHTSIPFEEASKRRDFTINAMGMEIPGLRLVDPWHGAEDLKNRRLRHVGPAFAEDSLRVLRGVQFCARFALEAAPETQALCRTLSLADLSRERIEEEFRKWLKGDFPSKGLHFFVQCGLDGFFSEIKPFQGSWEKLGEVLDALVPFRTAEDMPLMLAGLLSGDAAKPQEFIQKWLPTNEFLKQVSAIVATSLATNFDKASDATLRRAALQTDGIREPALLWLAKTAPEKDEPDCKQALLQALQEKATKLDVWDKAPIPYLTGQMLIGLGLKPGKEFGKLIKESFELQLDGTLQNADDALEWAKTSI
jgi:tRNA nucleotidyltransferase (CCA-adding enzyme)